VVGNPFVEHGFQLWVQRDVAVGVQFPDRNTQPIGRSDLHDCVDCQGEEFAFADSGAGEELDDQGGEGVGIGSGGAHEFRRCAVVEKSWERFVGDGQVTDEK